MRIWSNIGCMNIMIFIFMQLFGEQIDRNLGKINEMGIFDIIYIYQSLTVMLLV